MRNRKKKIYARYYIQFQIRKRDYVAVVTAAFTRNLFCVHYFFVLFSSTLADFTDYPFQKTPKGNTFSISIEFYRRSSSTKKEEILLLSIEGNKFD